MASSSVYRLSSKYVLRDAVRPRISRIPSRRYSTTIPPDIMAAPEAVPIPTMFDKMQHVKKYAKEDPLYGWDTLWKKQITPWDVGKIQPPLQEALMSSGIDFPRNGRAFVPGCGRGHDAIFISQTLGHRTHAIEISSTAVDEANKLLRMTDHIEDKGLVRFEVADFFNFKVDEADRFDLAYDYTFFVAIQPARRSDWGQKMAEVIKPGGYLITLVFPLDPPNDNIGGGPPYFMRPHHYEEVLPRESWEKVYDKVPEVSLDSHIGRERIAIWRRKST